MRRVVATLVASVVVGAAAPAAFAETYTVTTPGLSAFAVPAGVTSLSVSLVGGSGGDVVDNSGAIFAQGGRAALVTGSVAVTPGQQLQLTVATNGGKGNSQTGATGGTGAPDGGAAGWDAGGGGGATRILSCQSIVCSVAVIAAGGGGAGVVGFAPPSVQLPGGTGGAAGAPGGDGGSTTFAAAKGGQPGTPTSPGTGGAGAATGGPPPTFAGVAGGNGGSPTGGAGGNQTGTFNQQRGGGGGGGGVFGGGGGGSGLVHADGMSAVQTAGGGGGGGSSLAPQNGALVLAAPGAAPQIVITWTPPATPTPAPTPTPTPTPGPGPTIPPAVVLPVLTGTKLSPTAFPAAPSGASTAAKRRTYGTKVGFTLNIAASVRFTVVQSQTGRRAGNGTCAKPTKQNRAGRKCTRLVTLSGSFTRAAKAGANTFRFTGRLGNRALKPGKYRLVAAPSAGGRAGKTATASFRVVK